MSKRSIFLLTLASFLLVSFAIADDENHTASMINSDQVITQKSANTPEIYLEPGGSSILSGDCSDYIDLSGLPLPISVTGSTAGKTNDYGPYPEEPACWEGMWIAGDGAGPDVTYKWIVPADTSYVVSLRNSSYDTSLEIYDFTCPSEPVYPDDFICGNDDWTDIQSQLCLHLDQGQQILVVVDGYGNNSGFYQLEIFVGTIEPPVCPPNTSYGQSPAPTPPYTVLVSDVHYWSMSIIYDNLPATDIQVCGIQFYGFDLYGTDVLHECVEDPTVFEVEFYEEGTSGHPGNLIWGRQITPERVPMGLFYYPNQSELNLYRGELDTCLTINGGWISVQAVSYGGVPQNCIFWWLSSQEGDSICWKYANGQWYQYATSMSLCLLDSTALSPTCDYSVGDINGSGSADGLDVIYGVSYLKGGSAPSDSCDCPPMAFPFYGAMDVNGDCTANGIDITYFVSYLKGQQPVLLNCPDCPPARRGPAVSRQIVGKELPDKVISEPVKEEKPVAPIQNPVLKTIGKSEASD